MKELVVNEKNFYEQVKELLREWMNEKYFLKTSKKQEMSTGNNELNIEWKNNEKENEWGYERVDEWVNERKNK